MLEYNGVVVILKFKEIIKFNLFVVFLCYVIFFGFLFLFGVVNNFDFVLSKCFIKYFWFFVEFEIKFECYINNDFGWFFFKLGFFIVNCVCFDFILLIVCCKIVLFEFIFLFLVFFVNNKLFLLNCGYDGN